VDLEGDAHRMAARKRISAKAAMGWIGGATAVLTFVFAAQQLVGRIGGWREHKQRIAELVAVAREQTASRHYAEAWAGLDEAARIDSSNDDIQAAREDVAMQWLRAARVREGEQTFTELVKPLLPVLEQGALHARGARKADLLAHAGWADFLRWRDGARELAVDAQYKRALDVDPGNPFAHAMWGHWILFTGNDLEAARAHFEAALKPNRERSYIRSLQLAALLNLSSDQSDDELLRIANQMRKLAEPLDADYRNRIFGRACLSNVTREAGWTPSTARIPASDEIATLGWLNGADRDAYHQDMLRFCEARVHARAGNTTKALGLLRALATDAAGDATRERARQAAERLGAVGTAPPR
ncbi:MAG TPA: hypothetical protein VF021_05025, partial [Longimicrobiales bacterium]